MFELLVISVYFALLALPVVGIIVGLRYFPPDLDKPAPPSKENRPTL
jgi:hypothetical protein